MKVYVMEFKGRRIKFEVDNDEQAKVKAVDRAVKMGIGEYGFIDLLKKEYDSYSPVAIYSIEKRKWSK